MYTWEIDQLLKLKNYLLEIEEFEKICKTSPQIDRIGYNPYYDNYYIYTNDNYEAHFNVKKFVKEEEKNK